MPRHFQPWVADKWGFDLTYGLARSPGEENGQADAPPGEAARDSTDAQWSTSQPTTQPAVGVRPPGSMVDNDLTWFHLLPLAPFALMMIWLAATASKRMPPQSGAGPPGGASSSPGGGGPATTTPGSSVLSRLGPSPTAKPESNVEDIGSMPLSEAAEDFEPPAEESEESENEGDEKKPGVDPWPPSSPFQG